MRVDNFRVARYPGAILRCTTEMVVCKTLIIRFLHQQQDHSPGGVGNAE